MAKQKLAPEAKNRPMDALRPTNLSEYAANRLRSLPATSRFLLLEGPGTVHFRRWIAEQEEPLKTSAEDFMTALTQVAVCGQDVLDAIEQSQQEMS